jgi:two-component system, OmpR family, sensor histidine kinase CpxA
MNLRFRSLFLKIFLWFWVTVIATGIAFVATWIILQPKNAPTQQSMPTLADTAWISGKAAVTALEQEGPLAASAYIQQVYQRTHLKSCLFDTAGNPIAGSDCADFSDIGPRATPSETPSFTTKRNFLRVVVTIRGKSEHSYVYAMGSMQRRGPPPGITHVGFLLHWSAPLLVSGLICYLLTRHLTVPVLRVREASQHLAAGDLSTRAASGMERRRDELGSLVREFNAMAARIEELVSRQRQLIYEISHELRSPLARLAVALDLGRQRKGNDPAFDHIEQDIERLNEMIERLLTIARLDVCAPPVAMTRLDLTALVSQIANSAEFELQEHKGTMCLSSGGDYFVQGNAELLHSALENVVRNAVRYTGSGNAVDVRLEPAGTPNIVRIVVRDYGHGVPESELVKIFQPFYRVADDRNRESGGTGLGLAIADRVVRSHNGTISARNATPHGLEVEIRLPLATVP